MAKYDTRMTVETDDGKAYLQSSIVDTEGAENAPRDTAHAQEVFAENVASVLQENRFISLDDGKGSIALIPVRRIDLVTVRVQETGVSEDDEFFDNLHV